MPIAYDPRLVLHLPDTFTWQATSELLQRACSIQIVWTFQQLGRWSQHAAIDFVAAVRSLSRAQQQRLVLAPRFFNLLRAAPQPDEDDLTQLRRYIAAELRLAEGQPEGEMLWTALGDRCLSDSAAGGYAAPSLAGFVIDMLPDLYEESYPSAVGRAVRYEPGEADAVLTRLRASLTQLRTTSAFAATMVRSAVQVLNTVRTPHAPMLSSSMSRRMMIGWTGLLNIDRPDLWSVPRITNAILHEAIHSLIYKLELDYDLYTDDALAHRLTAASPWSGRTLQVHSFVHACFVWFGLANFWALCAERDPDVEAQQRRANSGFLAGHPLDGISPEAREIIQPCIAECIDHMYSTFHSSGAAFRN